MSNVVTQVLTLHQNLPTSGARRVAPFALEGEIYMAIPRRQICNRKFTAGSRGASSASKIFRRTGAPTLQRSKRMEIATLPCQTASPRIFAFGKTP